MVHDGIDEYTLHRQFRFKAASEDNSKHMITTDPTRLLSKAEDRAKVKRGIATNGKQRPRTSIQTERREKHSNVKQTQRQESKVSRHSRKNTEQ